MTGPILPGYVLEATLGHGSSGTVHLARRADWAGRVVAVKRVPRTGDAATSLLRHEAEVLAALDHPHIVRVLDLVSDGDGCAIAMQFAAGGSLADLLVRRGRLTPGEVVAVAAPIADALASAHRQGLVHCDVKPANVLFTSDGEPLLSDFGVARRTADVAMDGRAAGTAEYLDPEVAAGGCPDGRSDVYALGAVCYESLAGRPPFEAATPDGVVEAALGGSRTALAAAAPGTPTALVDAVERAMARRRADRFADAAAFAAALRAAVPPSPVVLGTAGDPGAPVVFDTAGNPGAPVMPDLAGDRAAPVVFGLVGDRAAPVMPDLAGDRAAPVEFGLAGDRAAPVMPDLAGDRAVPVDGAAPGSTSAPTDQPPAVPVERASGPSSTGAVAGRVPLADVEVPRDPAPAGAASPAPAPGAGMRSDPAPGADQQGGKRRLTREFGPRPPALVGPPARPARPARRRPRVLALAVAAVVASAVGFGAGAAVLSRPAARAAAGRTSGPSSTRTRSVRAASSCPPVAAGLRADADGDGCVSTLRRTGNVVEVDGRRYEVGRPGDALFVGDWDCNGTDTPALYRPATGEVFVFDRWADSGAAVTAADGGRFPAGAAIAVVHDAGGCDRLTANPATGGTAPR